jgi:hypothetical protein
MWLAVKRYLARIRHRRTFLAGLLLVLGIGIVCHILAVYVWHPEHQFHELATGFGDAFIIAFVLAMLVDPVVQEEFARDWGHDLYWAIFSPNAPAEFRDALQDMAAPEAYIDLCTHELDIRHRPGSPQGVLTIDWQISISGVVVNRRGLPSGGKVFVVPRHDGKPSSYTYWSFQTEDSERVAYNESELRGQNAIEMEASGRCVLDQSKLDNVPRVPFRKRFWSDRHVVTTRGTTDFLPLFQPRMVLKQTIIVKGPAASELDFYVTRLGGPDGEHKLQRYKRPDGTEQQRQDLDTVAFPGQTTMLFWCPTTGSTSQPESDGVASPDASQLNGTPEDLGAPRQPSETAVTAGADGTHA